MGQLETDAVAEISVEVVHLHARVSRAQEEYRLFVVGKIAVRLDLHDVGGFVGKFPHECCLSAFQVLLKPLVPLVMVLLEKVDLVPVQVTHAKVRVTIR